jgi:hypothetical protein
MMPSILDICPSLPLGRAGEGTTTGNGHGSGGLVLIGVDTQVPKHGGHPQEDFVMDTTTLLIIVIVVLLLGGGGWYGRGRWF